MGKRQFTSQASSTRAASGGTFGGFGFATASSKLSYLTEPPNLSSISDANVVVSFKNLYKKDGTTKSRALEDLRAYIQGQPHEQGGTEEAILEAWVNAYPRLAIDNSRRVRELSHNVQYELLRSARKRMEKYIPKVVGSWLAGTYDKDRAAARSANDGLTSFLDTDVKMTLFWKRCQGEILDYVEEAFNETVQTLSDERSVAVEDATEKYYRVTCACLHLLHNLLQKLNDEDIRKHQDRYEAILDNKKMWTLASCDDATTRTAADRLLAICLDTQTHVIKNSLDTISRAFITKALRSSQLSSALPLLKALLKLTHQFPEVWTSAYKGKHSAMDDLRSFVQKGSQGSLGAYWLVLRNLIENLPTEVFPEAPDAILDFLKSFRKGINNRDEFKGNAGLAWSSYLRAAKISIDHVPSSNRIDLVQESLFPIFEQYIHPAPHNSEWSVRSATPSATISAYICACVKNEQWHESLKQKWGRIAQEFIVRLQTSMPEQSKEYSTSQDAVIADSRRWFAVLSELLTPGVVEFTDNPLLEPARQIVESALQVIINRGGKPYSAAATVEASVRQTPKLFEPSVPLLEAVRSFVGNQLPNLMLSPSSDFLVSTLNHFRSLPGQQSSFEKAWQAAVDGLLSAPKTPERQKVITALLSLEDVKGLLLADQALQNYILEASVQATQGDQQEWPLFEMAVKSNRLTETTEKEVVQHLLIALDSTNSNIQHVFKALELISKQRPHVLREGDAHVEVITKLLALTELSDPNISLHVASLRASIDSTGGDDGLVKSSVVQVLNGNLEHAGSQSLSIDTLIQQAESIIDTSEVSSLHPELLPDSTKWSQALSQVLATAPSSALGVMRPFAGAIFLVRTQPAEQPAKPGRDQDGYSVALRMALYSAHLIRDHPDRFPKDSLVEILYLIGLTAELTNDQLDLLEANKLFGSPISATATRVQEFVGSLYPGCFQHIIPHSKAWREGFESGQQLEFSGAIHNLIMKLLKGSTGNTPTSFYSARILSRILPRLVEEHGWQPHGGDEWLSKLDILKPSTANIFGAVAVLAGLHEALAPSQLVRNLCNRLVSEVTGASAQAEKTLGLLVLLNSYLSVFDDDDLPVAQNRLVFAVKQILTFTTTIAETDYKLSAEACRALQKLLPGIKTVYGSYWEGTLEFCIKIWEMVQIGEDLDEKIPMMGMSLKVFAILSSLQDANDDLEDALVQNSERISHCFIKLMKIPRPKPTQPLEFIDNMLSRLICKIPLNHIEDSTELYPLLASENRNVQSAAFDILHRAIPSAQDEISINTLLEKKDARLPEELLSLLLDAPLMDNFEDEELSQFPLSIRSYLLSWQLVYDSFSTASWKVRKDYFGNLQSENCIEPLLVFLFDVLGHSYGKPLDLDKAHFDESYIRSYDLNLADAESNERNMHWLLINLYHLSLKHAGDLVRNWFSSCQSKQTRAAVESWTEKYFTPLLVSDKFDEIEAWAASPEAKEGGEKELQIKISRNKREVFAGYEIDETACQIVIRFPQNYPFYNVRVHGLNRVAVPEKKWRSWMLIVQGAITFSNGSLIDGLVTFRRNVEGSLKGHTECAICYSIISSEKTIPDKRCGTCKNMFHGACLYKWFATSNQSSCPLCRCAFSYGR